MAGVFVAGCGDDGGAALGDAGAPADVMPGADAERDGGPGLDAGPLDVAPGDGGDGSPRCPTSVEPAPGLVLTEAGPVRGVANGDAGWVYRGIPYVAPALGPDRWRPPRRPACRDGIFRADTFSAECPQYAEGGTIIGDEDCLGLNVWTPVGEPDGAPRPVLVWIHGGGHEQGSGSRAIYDGSSLARDHGVVVVTFNYRLGPLGFLSHPGLDEPGVPSGNQGMRDQLAALEWVRTNIAEFGGDPDRVMIFGQSAGSVSACRLVASPAAAGLFHAAVLQSGGCVATSRARARAIGVAYAARAGCSSDGEVRSCLEDKPVAELMAAFEPLQSGTNTTGPGTWAGVIDGDLLPASPRDLIAAGQHNPVPIIVGSTREENGRGAPIIQTEAQLEQTLRALYEGLGLSDSAFDEIFATYPVEEYGSPRDAYVAITSDVRFTCPAANDADVLAASQSAPVYRYLFAHTADNGSPALTALGAWHGIELFFVFGTLETASPLTAGPGDRAVTDAVQSAWTSLATEGQVDHPDWPAWDGTRLRLFEDGATTIDDPRAEACALWRTLLQN